MELIAWKVNFKHFDAINLHNKRRNLRKYGVSYDKEQKLHTYTKQIFDMQKFDFITFITIGIYALEEKKVWSILHS